MIQIPVSSPKVFLCILWECLLIRLPDCLSLWPLLHHHSKAQFLLYHAPQLLVKSSNSSPVSAWETRPPTSIPAHLSNQAFPPLKAPAIPNSFQVPEQIMPFLNLKNHLHIVTYAIPASYNAFTLSAWWLLIHPYYLIPSVISSWKRLYRPQRENHRFCSSINIFYYNEILHECVCLSQQSTSVSWVQWLHLSLVFSWMHFYQILIFIFLYMPQKMRRTEI